MLVIIYYEKYNTQQFFSINNFVLPTSNEYLFKISLLKAIGTVQ